MAEVRAAQTLHSVSKRVRSTSSLAPRARASPAAKATRAMARSRAVLPSASTEASMSGTSRTLADHRSGVFSMMIVTRGLYHDQAERDVRAIILLAALSRSSSEGVRGVVDLDEAVE